MIINLTDELLAKTKKGKIASAKQVFLEGDQENLQQIGEKTHQLEDAFKDITVSGGASTATAVSYNNETSGMTAVTAQGAIDELAAKNKTQDTIIESKADKSEVATELDKKFDKENIAQEFGDSKDKVVSQFALPFREIESPEFIKAIVDAEDHFLFGIQLDGSIEWGKGIPAPIRTKLQEIITQCQQDKTDLLGSINIVNGILDKTTIKDEAGEIQDTPFRVIENEEFIMAVVDSEDKVLFGIYRATGKPYYPQNDMYHISQSEEFLWVILDTANHPLLGIQQDGTCWAAKAQWLDDIKAIKEALLSIDETLKTFQPKEDGKGLINLDVADSFFYISNDEYIIAVVDAESRILAGIKYDGEPYFPNHEMYSVITNEEWLYAIIDAEDKVLGGFRADDGHMVVGGIDISTFITNAIIDIAYIKERTNHLSTIENDEYLSIETDAEGKVIGYTAPDGSHYLYKVKSETIPEEFEHIEDPEGRTEITSDADGKVMSYRDANGKKHEHDMEITNLDVLNLNLQGNSVNNIQDALKANGFDVKTPMDWSERKELQIPEPYCAFVNIKGELPTSKGKTTKGEIQFYDMQGNYFKKFIEMDIHGRTSAMYKKKNYTFDFYNDIACSDPFVIKFGDWVSMDSYYFQGWYSDAFRGIDIIEYKLYQQIISTRGYLKDKPYKYFTLKDLSSNGSENSKDIVDNFAKNALCTPMGFPVIMYLDGEFWGIYTIMLKKNRENFRMSKKDYNAVMLDLDHGDIVYGVKNWESFEIRNPKKLICMDGSKYDGDNPKELIDESSENFNPLNEDMVNTVKTKKAILRLADSYNSVKEAVSLNKTSEEIKTIIENFYNVDYIIDYLIFSNVIQNEDGWGGNWQWTTWDGVKWNPNPYDLNNSIGIDAFGTTAHSPVHTVFKSAITRYVYDYYLDEIKNRYKYLRDCNIISVKNIMYIFDSWIHRIGTDNFAKEFKKWNTTPSQRDSNLNSNYWEWSDGPLLSGTYPTYSINTSYSKGDIVQYNSKFYKSLIDNNIGNSLSDVEKWKIMYYDENIDYVEGDEVFLKSVVLVKFKCIKACRGQCPVTKYYDEAFGILGYYDSIGRIYKWFEEIIEYLDSVWNV